MRVEASTDVGASAVVPHSLDADTGSLSANGMMWPLLLL
jgi:hypothetical protein